MLERAPASVLWLDEQLAAQDRRLLHARVDRVRLLRDAVRDRLRARARDLDLLLRGRDGCGDLLVLRCDRAEVVELVEHVLKLFAASSTSIVVGSSCL